jgi:hypothetical protein
VRDVEIRPSFQVQQRIVGLAHDADFQRDATGKLVETTDDMSAALMPVDSRLGRGDDRRANCEREGQ